MWLIPAVAALSGLLGAILASGANTWSIRPGLVGLAVLLASAWAARRWWQRLSPEDAPGSPERILWHGLVCYALLAGHLATGMWLLGPAPVMHSPGVHALALDNWTLLFGALLSYWIARDPEPRSDERDRMIRNRGLFVANTALIGLLVPLILALGFGEGTAVARLSQPVLAHVLILFLILQCLAHIATQLVLYRRDAAAERASS